MSQSHTPGFGRFSVCMLEVVRESGRSYSHPICTVRVTQLERNRTLILKINPLCETVVKAMSFTTLINSKNQKVCFKTRATWNFLAAQAIESG
jgi:hypothetical protein